MRTDAILPLVAVIIACASNANATDAEQTPPPSPNADKRFTAIFGIEAAIVGLSVGPRAELLYRLGPPGTSSHLRTTGAVLFGPEFVYIPVGFGYRAVFRQEKLVQPLLGLGYEAHFFLTDGGHAFAQWGVAYVEGGTGFRMTDRVSIGAAVSLEFSFIGEPGPGLAPRVFGAFRF
jgi:hypothetical protein